jgi:hypothetical protein
VGSGAQVSALGVLVLPVGNSEQLHAVQVFVLAEAPVDVAQSVEPQVLAHLVALELEALAIPVALEQVASAVLVYVAQLAA